MGENNTNGLVPVVASIGSVFYRRPRPGEPPFVEVGSEVNEGDIVCMLEVMKSFKRIPSPAKGRIENILVEDAQRVTKGQHIMLIKPS